MLTKEQQIKVAKHNANVSRRIELGTYKPFERGTVLMATRTKKSKKIVRATGKKATAGRKQLKKGNEKGNGHVGNRGRIVKLFHGSQTLTTRDVFKQLNKGREKVAIGEVRRLVRSMIGNKHLKVKAVEKRMFTLQKIGR